MSRGFRIAELSRRTSTPKETIHYYLRIGLLRKPKKTSHNMAYYDDSRVEQLRLIKRLRTESYLPLSVIKKVLKEGKLAESARRIDLAGDLFGQGAKAEYEPMSRAVLAKRAGVSEKRITAYEEAGLLLPAKSGKSNRYGWEDLRVIEILAHADEEAGAGAHNFLIERFQVLERHIAEMVREESAHFFASLLATSEPAVAWDLLRGGRDTVGRYLAVARVRRLRHEIEGLLAEVERPITAERVDSCPLPKKRRRALGESKVKAGLVEAHESRKNQLAPARALFEHLVAQADNPEIVERYEALRPKLAADPRIHALYTEALMEVQRYGDAIAQAERLLEDRSEGDGMLDLVLSCAVLGRLRDRIIAATKKGDSIAAATSSVEVISELVRGLSHLHRSHAAPPPKNLGAGLRFRLLLGRLETAMPRFLGRRSYGRKALRGLFEELDLLRGTEQDPGLGVLDRVELNTARALERHTTRSDEKAAMQAKIVALETA